MTRPTDDDQVGAAAAHPAILMLAAHEDDVDRRVVAEANSLAASGRSVTLVETAAQRSAELASPVRWIGPETRSPGRASRWLRRRLNRLPERVRPFLRSVPYLLGRGADRALTRYFRAVTPRERFAAIHCHDLPTLPAALALRDALPGRPRVIYDSHELFPEQHPGTAFERYWRRLEEELAGGSDAVICVNPAVARRLGQRTGSLVPEVLYNSFGLPSRPGALKREELAARVGDPAPGVVVVFQGYWAQDRNLDALVAAFDLLGPAFRLYLFGKGPLGARIRRAAARARHANVFVAGWIPATELIGWIRGADFGVIPYSGGLSPNHQLCTPNKLFEFIEAEIPICASDLPELQRIVAGSSIGHVARMETPAEIADALREAQARQERGAFSAESLASAREQFGWARQERALLRLYEGLGC